MKSIKKFLLQVSIVLSLVFIGPKQSYSALEGGVAVAGVSVPAVAWMIGVGVTIAGPVIIGGSCLVGFLQAGPAGCWGVGAIGAFVGVPVTIVGLVILDENNHQNNQFTEMTEAQSKFLDVTDSERVSFNADRNLLNVALQDFVSEAVGSDLPFNDLVLNASDSWNAIDSSVSDLTKSAIKKIAIHTVTSIQRKN